VCSSDLFASRDPARLDQGLQRLQSALGR
jgi:hypothetical protein